MPDNIKERLFEMQDTEYAAFQRKLIPNIAPDTVIGVRTPLLRKLAKELRKDGNCAEDIQKAYSRAFAAYRGMARIGLYIYGAVCHRYAYAILSR